jgi:hypothetical protein
MDADCLVYAEKALRRSRYKPHVFPFPARRSTQPVPITNRVWTASDLGTLSCRQRQVLNPDERELDAEL